jgi:hypothetical protein
MKAKGTKSATPGAGDNSPGLRLNRRMKDILATGLLPSLSPSALTVLTYAAAHGDFKSCTVFLGAKTIAARLGWNRKGARDGIAELLDVGFLVVVKAATFRQATVYRLAIVPELVKAAQERQEKLRAMIADRRRPGREGAPYGAPRGNPEVPPGDTPGCPQGEPRGAPKHTSTVPSALKERSAGDRSARRPQRQGAGEHERRLKDAAIKKRGTA